MKTLTRLTMTCLTAAILSACGGSGSTQPTQTTPPSIAQNTVYEGVWLNPDFAEVLAVSGNDVAFYQLSADNCLQTGAWSVSELTNRLGGLTLSGDVLTSQHLFDLEARRYSRQAELPSACAANQLTQASDAAQLNFDWFWQSVSDHYAGFEVRDVDWIEVKAESNSRLASGDDLWSVMADAMDTLQDPHAMLISPNQGVKRSTQYTSLHYQVAESAGVSVAEAPVEQRLMAWGQMVAEHHLSSPQLLETEQAIYGELADATPYMNLRSMNLDGDDNQANADMAARVLTLLMPKLVGKTELVIDLRFNYGGSVLAAQTLADGLANRDGEAYSMAYKNANGYSEGLSFATEANGNGFQGRITVLTSPITGSAAEAFIYYLKAGNEVRLVGETTRGIQSGPSARALPNGWTLLVPHRKVIGADGIYRENSGFIPDVEMVSFLDEDLEQGVDPVLVWLME